MRHTPDYKYIRGKEFLEKLSGIEGEEIRYYVEQINKHSEKQHKRIKEMREVFKQIAVFGR